MELCGYSPKYLWPGSRMLLLLVYHTLSFQRGSAKYSFTCACDFLIGGNVCLVSEVHSELAEPLTEYTPTSSSHK